jgi:tRNA pseudouridine55 synthase
MAAPPFHGLLVLEKPGRITSRAALDRAVAWFPRGTRLGHAGTLDPLATGVLVACVGAATRLTEYVQGMPKTYRAVFLLGARSDTDDADGTITAVPGGRQPDPAAVTRELEAFRGEIQQVPPAFSAARVTGQRAYDLARAGREVSLAPRPVRVYDINVVTYNYPELELVVHCGKGTYIRSLARDLGGRLGCGALVRTLRRVRVGPFSEADALGLDADAATAKARLLPVSAAVAGLPRVTLGPQEVNRLRHGQGVPLPRLELPEGVSPEAENAAVFDTGGNLVALARIDRAKGWLPPDKVFPALG